MTVDECQGKLSTLRALINRASLLRTLLAEETCTIRIDAYRVELSFTNTPVLRIRDFLQEDLRTIERQIDAAVKEIHFAQLQVKDEQNVR